MSSLVFITGAKGFLGRYCARRFSSEGWTVAGLGHGEWPEEERQSWGLGAWLNASVSVEALERLTERTGLPKAIIHCAGSGSVGFSYENPQEDFARTVGSTVEVLEFARKHGPKIQIVYPSSAAVYGAAARLPISEDSPLAPVSPYGKHKLMAEESCRLYAKEWGISLAAIRFFSLYGEELRKQLLWDACGKASQKNFSFFGSGEEERDWLHVTDAARLICLAAGRAGPDVPVVNGGTGQGTSTRRILTMLGKLWQPAMIPVFTGQARIGDPHHLTADAARLREWGFSPSMPLEQGLREYVAWFQKRVPHD